MAKPIKSQWAFGDSSYRVQPPGGKMNVGWLSGEKPPFQYFNWLHYNYNLWEDYFEAKAETISPTMLQSSGTATWNGSVLALSAILNISFRVTTGEQINQLPLGNYTFNDGEVLVFRKDKTNPSPVSLASGTYASLGNGQYAIIAEASLTANAHEFEVVLFRRRGTSLECPINGTIWATGETITFGRSSGIPTVITDHGALSGLADDDHPQYAQIAGSETISGLWNYTTLPTASANPTTSTQLARKAYVYSVAGVTDHGALTSLSDDDHPQYARNAANENITGNWDFQGSITADTPTTSAEVATKGYVDSKLSSGSIVAFGRITALAGSASIVGDSFNIDSVSGGYLSLTINFDNAIGDTNYVIVGYPRYSAYTAGGTDAPAFTITRSSGSFDVDCGGSILTLSNYVFEFFVIAI